MRNFKFILLACSFLVVGCTTEKKSEREIAEEKGAELLNQARVALGDSDFQKAYELIDSIRSTYPLALNVREQGILLKDSVQLEEAREEFRKAHESGLKGEQLEEAQMKIEFFLRKLKHDKERSKTH